ncbi:MAG: hypothetical protein GXP38_15210 [Chloroflexi bacterium]|nr:hypothetical protein [Chloroflexota bacterium]
MINTDRDQDNTATLPTYIWGAARRNSILVLLILLLVALTLLQGYGLRDIATYYKWVEWNTIAALTGILIITTGVRESNFLGKVASQILHGPMSERYLAGLLIMLSALLATVLTNDITLFIIVPLTMSLQAQLKNDITKIIVFEIIAVNVGSALTPLGNPQNLFLWHEWGLSFSAFVVKMMPLVILLLLLLLILARFSFTEHRLKVMTHTNEDYDARLLIFSLLMLCGYLVAFELRWAVLTLPLIAFVVYAVFYRHVLQQVDWPVLLIFILMFVDFGLISELKPVVVLMERVGQMGTGGIFLCALLISQAISNVPAAILLSRFSHNWLAIAYGVNVGGNGLVIASLANLIALRMAGSTRIWLKFHEFSLIYLSVSAFLIYFLLRSHSEQWLATLGRL